MNATITKTNATGEKTYPAMKTYKGKTYTLKEVFERGESFLNKFYDTNLKLKY